MNIDIMDNISLNDNNEYVVVSKANYKNKVYYFLVDINDNSNIKFCYEKPENHSLVESANKDLNRELLPLFFEATKPYVDPELLNKLIGEN